MNELIKINYDAEKPTISGRDLHQALEVQTDYRHWFQRMCEYGFNEGLDFRTFLTESTGGRPATDHQLTISMAKELCMLQRNEKGKQFRQYFIEIEEKWNSPEKVMARALKIANDTIADLNTANKALKAENSQLTVEKTIMLPKAEYFDELVDRNLLMNFRDTAKELKVKQKTFIDFLIEKKYIYRDKSGKIKPYAKFVNEGVFEIKEQFNEKTNWTGSQTLITPKGRETFRLLMV